MENEFHFPFLRIEQWNQIKIWNLKSILHSFLHTKWTHCVGLCKCLPNYCPVYSLEFEDLHRFNQPCIFSVVLGIKQLPIDKALSKFLSESFPYFIDVEIRDFDNAPSHSEKATSSKLTSSISNQNAEEDSIPIDGKQDIIFDILQYEIPELHSFLLPMDKSAFILRTLGFFLTFPLLKRRKCPVLKPCCNIPSIVNNQFMQLMKSTRLLLWRKKVDYLEDGGSIQGQYLSLTTRFPLLEADEAALGIVSDIPTKINF